MRPKRIILIRHGESEGNADGEIYSSTPDFKLKLTPKGKEQAKEAGKVLKNIFGDESLYVYVSPYTRTRQTFKHIRPSIEENIVRVVEDPRIREQDWGHLQSKKYFDEIIKIRDDFSTFYYRIPDGESGADVYDRVSIFFDTLHRDFENPDYPQNVLIVTHGMTLRLFLMRWFHWSVEEFELVRNPKNCQIVVMELQPDGHYKLIDNLRRREKLSE